MYNENNTHLELIVKDGTVTIPSIFMFEDYLTVSQFLDHARNMNCTVVFENESVEVKPITDDSRFKIYIYSQMVGYRELGNAYVRYLGNIDKMSWENVGK